MTPDRQSTALLDLCAIAPVIPVLVVDEVAQAVPLARALVAGGLPVLEVTLRTEAALDVIAAMATVPGARVGAGTVLDRDAAMRARDAGAAFAVSPGATGALIDACGDAALPLLPGAATASEVMALLDRGYRALKFFPAGPAGGPAMLKALGGPLPMARFCPTGGIGPTNAGDYLALPNVLCVGGSWVAPPDAVKAGDWGRIERLAREAAALRS